MAECLMQSPLIVSPARTADEPVKNTPDNIVHVQSLPLGLDISLHDYYVNYVMLDHVNGKITSASRSVNDMFAQAKQWMPKLLKILAHCDIDPTLHTVMLHLNANEWREWQEGRLETIPINTTASGRLLLQIFSLIYCFVGSWDNVSWWLNHVKHLKIFNDRCPLDMIKSGEIDELLRLRDFLAGNILGSPFP